MIEFIKYLWAGGWLGRVILALTSVVIIAASVRFLAFMAFIMNNESDEPVRMNDEEIIARQARKIEHLERRVTELEEAKNEARRHLYCIGGPLNDNKLGYSKEQLATFFRIAECLDV